MPGSEARARALRARLAAHALHAKVADPAAHTAPARRAFLDRFEREVDPDNVLSQAERARRAAHARKAYFSRLALASAQVRSGKRSKRRGAAATAEPASASGTSVAAEVSRSAAPSSTPACRTGRSRSLDPDGTPT